VGNQYAELLELMVEMSQGGQLGLSIQASLGDYQDLAGEGVFLKCVIDSYTPDPGQPPEIAALRAGFSDAITDTHSVAAIRSPDAARALIFCLLEDFPGAPGTCLLPKFNDLAMACIGFRSVAMSDDRPVIWKLASSVFSAYNEFLNGVCGFILLCLSEPGKVAPRTVFATPYARKLHQLQDTYAGNAHLANLPVVHRLAEPHIRNALAHGTAWLNGRQACVHYIASNGKRNSISLVDFMGSAMAGSHLPQSFLAGIGTVVLMENGSERARALLAERLKELRTD